MWVQALYQDPCLLLSHLTSQSPLVRFSIIISTSRQGTTFGEVSNVEVEKRNWRQLQIKAGGGHSPGRASAH